MEKSLRDLLARLPIPGLKESNDRHVVADVLSKEFSFPVKPNQIDIKEGILSVSVPPVMKSALHVRQQLLIEKLSSEGIKITKIR